MKIVAISDVHGQFERVYKICKDEAPDMIIFSGDGIEDVRQVSYIFEDIKFHMVVGNCDYMDKAKDEEIIDVCGKKILLAHGHLYGVKRSYDEIRERGEALGVDAIVFGHTHLPYLDEDEVTLFNPGAVLMRRYGVIIAKEDQKLEFIHKEVY